MKRHPSTISRELARNSGQRGYLRRKSDYCLLAHVIHKTSEAVSDAIVRSLMLIKARVSTLMFDNGLEFAGHDAIDQVLGSISYFAAPYSAWQRCTNENTMAWCANAAQIQIVCYHITHDELAMIMHRLNHRLRKRLNWKTPHEVFTQSFNRVAFRA